MPRNRKYFFSALIGIILGVLFVNTWHSRTALTNSKHIECQNSLPMDDGQDDSEEAGGNFEAIVGIQSYPYPQYAVTTRYFTYPILHTYLRRQYLDVLTPPPWLKA